MPLVVLAASDIGIALFCILGVASFLGRVFLLPLRLLFVSFFLLCLPSECLSYSSCVKSFLSSYRYHPSWAEPTWTHGLMAASLLTAAKSLSPGQIESFTLGPYTVTQQGQNKTPRLSQTSSPQLISPAQIVYSYIFSYSNNQKKLFFFSFLKKPLAQTPLCGSFV